MRLSNFFLRVAVATRWIGFFSRFCAVTAIRVRRWELREEIGRMRKVTAAVRSLPHMIWDEEDPIPPGEEKGPIDKNQWKREVGEMAKAGIYRSGLQWDDTPPQSSEKYTVFEKYFALDAKENLDRCHEENYRKYHSRQ